MNFNATINRSKITRSSRRWKTPPTWARRQGNIGNFQFVQINAVGHAPNTFFLYQQKYDDSGKPLQGPTASPELPAQYVDQPNGPMN